MVKKNSRVQNQSIFTDFSLNQIRLLKILDPVCIPIESHGYKSRMISHRFKISFESEAYQFWGEKTLGQ